MCFRKSGGWASARKRKGKHKMTTTEAELSGLTFGCELEYEGIGKEAAARVVARTVGGTATYVGGYGYLDPWEVKMRDGRKWRIVYDGSLSGTSSETVTPILTLADLPMLESVVKALRHNGARISSKTGLHIHVGLQDATPMQIKNLVRIFYKQEELILKAVGTRPERLGYYTKRTDKGFVERICRIACPTMMNLNAAWYGSYTERASAHNDFRYRAMNLNNLWGGNAKHTVEFRFFEATTISSILRADVLLALLIVLKAKSAKASSAKHQRTYNAASAKYDLRVFLLRLGANGPYFKEMRKILMKRMPGSAAWKDGRHDRPRANG